MKKLTPVELKLALSPGSDVDNVIRRAKLQAVEYSDDADQRCLRLILRNVRKGFWTTKSITYVVHYNEERVVVTCETADIFTGP